MAVIRPVERLSFAAPASGAADDASCDAQRLRGIRIDVDLPRGTGHTPAAAHWSGWRAAGGRHVEAYRFDPFIADTVRRRLWRNGRLVPVTAKTFDLLVVLIERRGQVVSKDELLDRVWPNTTVQENNLARQVSSLRRALGQRPDQADYLVTSPGQGYRFVASVQELAELPLDLATVGPAASQEAAADVADMPVDEVPAAHAALDEGGGGDVEERAAGRTPRQTAVVAIVGAVLAIAVAVGVLERAGTDGQANRALERITYDDTSMPRDVSWSPDGQWIVYASDRAGNADLWKQRLGDPDPVRLTFSDEAESDPDWSPDGGSIVFRSERDGGGLFVMPAGGGGEHMVSSFGYEPHWSPNGTTILFKRSTILPDLPAMFVVGIDGKPPRPLRPDVLGEFSGLHAAWHPDGRHVSLWGVRRGEMTFVNVPLETGDATPLTMPAQVTRDLAGVVPGRFVWARSRRQIYFEGIAGETHDVWRVGVDPAANTLIDRPQRLTTGVGEETGLAVSPDGTRVLFTTVSSRTRLWAFPLDTSTGRIRGEPRPITQGHTGEVEFDAQSDGSKVAYRAVRAGRDEIWERSVGEGWERLLLSSPRSALIGPRWSPDGAKLAFSRCASLGDTPVAAVFNTDGSGERLLTRPKEVGMLVTDWSRDGQSILGACRFRLSDPYATCVVPLSKDGGADPVRVIASDPTRNLHNQRFSPDQRWIAFLAHDLAYSATSTVYVIPATGGSWRAITDSLSFDDKPHWGPDGRVLYYVSNRGGLRNVWGRRFDDATGMPIGQPFPVTSFASAQFQMTPRIVQMDIAVTATHLLLPMREARSDIWMLTGVDR